MSASAQRRSARYILASLVTAVLVSVCFAAPAAGKSVVFSGIDAEDGGPNAHGPIANYCQLVNSMLADVDGTKAAAPDGVLVLGSKGYGGPSAFWSAIAGCISAPVEQIGTASGIAGADIANAKMIAVVSSASETTGGLDQSEQDALLARASEITDHVNAGGALLGFSQTGLSNEYQYVGGVGALAVSHYSYSDITPTPAGIARGITNSLDVCCWHDVYTTVPSGFQVLAFEGASGNAAAIGTGGTVSSEVCTNGVDDDGDGKVDGADPDCATVEPENCFNGVDDDGDGLIDSADPNCQATEGPAGDATCSDGQDNDNDGNVDGADSDCQAPPPPPGGGPPSCSGQTATIYFGSGYPGTNTATVNSPTTVVGTPGDDVIVTGNGNDKIDGAGGNDLVCSNDGNDQVQGSAGNDRLISGRGDDLVGGGSGDDYVNAGLGDDTVRGAEGNDYLLGADGDDRVEGNRGDDDVQGNRGRDELVGAQGTDNCNGGLHFDRGKDCETSTNIEASL